SGGPVPPGAALPPCAAWPTSSLPPATPRRGLVLDLGAGPWGSLLLVGVTAGDAAHDHGRLAAVGVLRSGTGLVQHEGDRLASPHALLFEERIQALPEPAQLAERVDNAGRPVDTDDQAATLRLRPGGERRLDQPRDAVRLAPRLAVIEGLHRAAEGLKPGRQVLLADDAEVRGLDRPAVRAQGGQQPPTQLAAKAVAVGQGREVRAGQARRFQDRLLLGGAGQAAELGDERADRAV